MIRTNPGSPLVPLAAPNITSEEKPHHLDIGQQMQRDLLNGE